jgi:histidyl-tRNA synthetase
MTEKNSSVDVNQPQKKERRSAILDLPPGFIEYAPETQILFNAFLNVIRKNFELFGFSPIETPAVERKGILTSKGGNEKEIYALSRLAGEPADADTDLALHFDLTVPLARYVALHERQLEFPFRRYQIQKVWRGERSQVGKGRFREFYQCDIDVINRNTLSIRTDAEIPSVIYRIFTELRIGRFVIQISNKKLVEGFLLAVGVPESHIVATLHILDGLEKDGRKAVINELNAIEIPGEVCERILAFITGNRGGEEIIPKLASTGNLLLSPAQQQSTENDQQAQKSRNKGLALFSLGIEELKEVIETLSDFGLPKEYYQVDVGVIRGLDYYTGTIYETILVDHPKWGSVCSGGRYDNLTQHFSDKKLPGVGISIGLTRLFEVLLKEQIINVGKKTPADVFVTALDPTAFNHYAGYATALRAAGIATEVYLEDRRLMDQLSYANAKGFRIAIVAGEDEFKKDAVQIKNLVTRASETCSVELFIGRVKEILHTL